ncbi:hypothetical protein I8752_03915 [Nostocaceae cyanobacterium CENA369]|uniref:Uncharacterized protein n=1 Tax=Dendronalium phyllosphericum CENA369 TaxID=1725256 RepID=A0A8J7LDX7_9NOST|nr:hypothetical protein [Dendronalium phyllosphericum]MBH8572194.1 hypothetical protein [Dendronalium phyllosphericum CENA369]
MNSPDLLKIERELSSFSLEQLEWLLERITKQVQTRKQLENFKNVEYINEQLVTMANDLDIQAEITFINDEFSVTEMDGLEKL